MIREAKQTSGSYLAAEEAYATAVSTAGHPTECFAFFFPNAQSAVSLTCHIHGQKATNNNQPRRQERERNIPKSTDWARGLLAHLVYMVRLRASTRMPPIFTRRIHTVQHAEQPDLNHQASTEREAERGHSVEEVIVLGNAARPAAGRKS